jgi:hypothetical protein
LRPTLEAVVYALPDVPETRFERIVLNVSSDVRIARSPARTGLVALVDPWPAAVCPVVTMSLYAATNVAIFALSALESGASVIVAGEAVILVMLSDTPGIAPLTVVVGRVIAMPSTVIDVSCALWYVFAGVPRPSEKPLSPNVIALAAPVSRPRTMRR